MEPEQTFDRNTQEYFRRVMDQWSLSTEVDHPYLENLSWQRRYKALQAWIADLNLIDGKVLEVGCATGLLQYLAPNYAGIDIAESAAHFMDRPFYVASATALPFPDDYFDGAWSFWVLEHVEQPEIMLAEMRRVVKPGGSVFLVAAYAVDSWVSQGLHKRPFKDLSMRRRLTKLTISVRASIPYKIARTLPGRLYDLANYLYRRQPMPLRYLKLQPNYQVYWDYDADACCSLDSFSVALYFLSRGDQSYYGRGIMESLWQRSQPQAYIICK
jgi:ubiquinone/menaquinone biosynthesis C-methylase UbiE